MTERGAYVREVAEAEGARRERERLLTELSDELARHSPDLPSSVLIDNLWGWLMWQRQRGQR